MKYPAMFSKNNILWRFSRFWFSLWRQRPVLATFIAVIPIFWPAWLYRKSAFEDEVIDRVTMLARQAAKLQQAIQVASRHKQDTRQQITQYKSLLFSLRYEFDRHSGLIHKYLDGDPCQKNLPLHANELLTLLSGPLLHEIYESTRGIPAFQRRYADKLAVVLPERVSSIPMVSATAAELAKKLDEHAQAEDDDNLLQFAADDVNLLSWNNFVSQVEARFKHKEKKPIGLMEKFAAYYAIFSGKYQERTEALDMELPFGEDRGDWLKREKFEEKLEDDDALSPGRAEIEEKKKQIRPGERVVAYYAKVLGVHQSKRLDFCFNDDLHGLQSLLEKAEEEVQRLKGVESDIELIIKQRDKLSKHESLLGYAVSLEWLILLFLKQEQAQKFKQDKKKALAYIKEARAENEKRYESLLKEKKAIVKHMGLLRESFYRNFQHPLIESARRYAVNKNKEASQLGIAGVVEVPALKSKKPAGYVRQRKVFEYKKSIAQQKVLTRASERKITQLQLREQSIEHEQAQQHEQKQEIHQESRMLVENLKFYALDEFLKAVSASLINKRNYNSCFAKLPSMLVNVLLRSIDNKKFILDERAVQVVIKELYKLDSEFDDIYIHPTRSSRRGLHVWAWYEFCLERLGLDFLAEKGVMPVEKGDVVYLRYMPDTLPKPEQATSPSCNWEAMRKQLYSAGIRDVDVVAMSKYFDVTVSKNNQEPLDKLIARVGKKPKRLEFVAKLMGCGQDGFDKVLWFLADLLQGGQREHLIKQSTYQYKDWRFFHVYDDLGFSCRRPPRGQRAWCVDAVETALMFEKVCAVIKPLLGTQEVYALCRMYERFEFYQKCWCYACLASINPDDTDLAFKVRSAFKLVAAIEKLGIELLPVVSGAHPSGEERMDFMLELKQVFRLYMQIKRRHGGAALLLQNRYMNMPAGLSIPLRFIQKGGKFVHKAMLLTCDGDDNVAQRLFGLGRFALMWRRRDEQGLLSRYKRWMEKPLGCRDGYYSTSESWNSCDFINVREEGITAMSNDQIYGSDVRQCAEILQGVNLEQMKKLDLQGLCLDKLPSKYKGWRSVITSPGQERHKYAWAEARKLEQAEHLSEMAEYDKLKKAVNLGEKEMEPLIESVRTKIIKEQAQRRYRFCEEYLAKNYLGEDAKVDPKLDPGAVGMAEAYADEKLKGIYPDGYVKKELNHRLRNNAKYRELQENKEKVSLIRSRVGVVKGFFVIQALFLRFVATHYAPEHIVKLIAFWEDITSSSLKDFTRSSFHMISESDLENYKLNQEIWNTVCEELSRYPQLEEKQAGEACLADEARYAESNLIARQIEPMKGVYYAEQDINALVNKISAAKFLKPHWQRQLLQLNNFNAALMSGVIVESSQLKGIIRELPRLHQVLTAILQPECKLEARLKAPMGRLALFALEMLSDMNLFDNRAGVNRMFELLIDINNIKENNEDKQASAIDFEFKLYRDQFAAWQRRGGGQMAKLKLRLEKCRNHITDNLHMLGLALLRQCQYSLAPDPKKRIWLRPEQAIVVLQSTTGINTSLQVKTGEGKTFSSALIAILSALAGNRVVVTSSNNILAEEGAQAAQWLARYCGLTVAFLDETYATQRASDITYQTCENAAMSARQQAYVRAFAIEDTPEDKASPPRPLHLIHDEDDQTHINDAASTAYIGAERSVTASDQSNELMRFLEKVVRFKYGGVSGATLSETLSEDQYFQALTVAQQEHELEYWEKAFKQAKGYQLNVDYVISNLDMHGKRHIQLVSKETGIVQPCNCYLQDGVHHILVMRERLRDKLHLTPTVVPDMVELKYESGHDVHAHLVKRTITAKDRQQISLPTETVTMYQTSAAALSHSADLITGLSGTTGDAFAKQPELLRQLFGSSMGCHVALPIAKRANTPQFVQWTQVASPESELGYQTVYSRRFIQEPRFVRNKQQYFALLFKSIRQAQSNDQEFKISAQKNPPVLVIFKTIDEVKQFYEYCIQRDLQDVVVYDGMFPEDDTLTEGARLPEEVVLEKAKQGYVVLATFLAGRGVDFKQLRYAFIPHGLEDSMMQSASRAARNMDKGVVVPVVNLEDLAMDMRNIGLSYDVDLSPKLNLFIYQTRLQKLDLDRIQAQRDYNQTLDQLQRVFFNEFAKIVKDNPRQAVELKHAWCKFFDKIAGWPAAAFATEQGVKRIIGAIKVDFKSFPGLSETVVPKYLSLQERERNLCAVALAVSKYHKRSCHDGGSKGVAKYRQLCDFVANLHNLKLSDRLLDKRGLSRQVKQCLPDFVEVECFWQCFSEAKQWVKHEAAARLAKQKTTDACMCIFDGQFDKFKQNSEAHKKVFNKPSIEARYMQQQTQALSLMKQFKHQLQLKLEQLSMMDLVAEVDPKLSPAEFGRELEHRLRVAVQPLCDDKALAMWLKEKTGWTLLRAQQFIQQDHSVGIKANASQVPSNVYRLVMHELKQAVKALVGQHERISSIQVQRERERAASMIKQSATRLPQSKKVNMHMFMDKPNSKKSLQP